jgi:hypothetical protein
LGFRRDSLEGDGQFENSEEMPELPEKVLATDLQKREGKPMNIRAIISVVVIVADGIE